MAQSCADVVPVQLDCDSGTSKAQPQLQEVSVHVRMCDYVAISTRTLS